MSESGASAGGTVRRVSRKSEAPGAHGLPKLAVPEARLTPAGVEGDFNRYRHEEKSDDPRMAILLLPVETIEELAKEGWPVRPGDLGENITSEGLSYTTFSVGRRFRVGGARLEITKPCDPCDNLYLLPYVGPARGPEFMKTLLGRRGWYARVLEPGVVRPGDAIIAET
jgi:MOSC domain-containing protein YiiM